MKQKYNVMTQINKLASSLVEEIKPLSNEIGGHNELILDIQANESKQLMLSILTRITKFSKKKLYDEGIFSLKVGARNLNFYIGINHHGLGLASYEEGKLNNLDSYWAGYRGVNEADIVKAILKDEEISMALFSLIKNSQKNNFLKLRKIILDTPEENKQIENELFFEIDKKENLGLLFEFGAVNNRFSVSFCEIDKSPSGLIRYLKRESLIFDKRKEDYTPNLKEYLGSGKFSKFLKDRGLDEVYRVDRAFLVLELLLEHKDNILDEIRKKKKELTPIRETKLEELKRLKELWAVFKALDNL